MVPPSCHANPSARCLCFVAAESVVLSAVYLMCLTAIFGACTILCLHDSATEACFLDGKVYVLGGMHLDWKVVTTGMRPCTASAYFGRLLGARRCRNSCYGRIWFCLKLLRVSARGLGVARHIKQILVQRRLRSWKPLVLIARPTDN